MNLQSHNHGGRSHLLGMLGIGAVVLVVLLAAGRSFGEALPLAALLACPVMMIGMMFMMRGGNGHEHGHEDSERHEGAADETHSHDATATTLPARITITPTPGASPFDGR